MPERNPRVQGGEVKAAREVYSDQLEKEFSEYCVRVGEMLGYMLLYQVSLKVIILPMLKTQIFYKYCSLLKWTLLCLRTVHFIGNTCYFCISSPSQWV